MKIIAAFEKAVPWFLLTIVVYIYCISRASSIWPPGHPWSGVCLLLLACNLFVEAYDFKINPLLKSILRVLAIITSLLWVCSTFNK